MAALVAAPKMARLSSALILTSGSVSVSLPKAASSAFSTNAIPPPGGGVSIVVIAPSRA